MFLNYNEKKSKTDIVDNWLWVDIDLEKLCVVPFGPPKVQTILNSTKKMGSIPRILPPIHTPIEWY